MLATKLSTYRALGVSNLLRVGAYRLGLKSKLHRVLRITAEPVHPPFFDVPRQPAPNGARPRESWGSSALYFWHHQVPLGGPPDWHTNPLNGVSIDATLPWNEIGDFSSGVGDIKTVWEASRFDWVTAMAQRAAANQTADLSRLNEWLTDWAQKNPGYYGPNWKCGQEASIRVLHLALAAMVLGQTTNTKAGCRMLVKNHLRRIAPTISYAIGQQNNHATSEAAALFVGGTWLAQNGDPEGVTWSKTGRKWLESCAANLIEPDGTFSQYSVNYHRVALDTYSFAETWRRLFDEPRFSQQLYTKLSAATLWLYNLTQSGTGDAPNLGANDGARILALTDTDYRDFRPSVQLASALFLGKKAYPQPGPYDQPLIWLGVAPPVETLPKPQSISFDFGGLHVLRSERAAVYLRYPKFQFRPGQADILHTDLWVDGQNILSDAGTYSYNATVQDTAYFNGVQAHNTIQFDDRDQMPRISRFLFGDWPKTDAAQRAGTSPEGGQTASARYTDYKGATHERRITLQENLFICEDKVSGTASKATLRWRLPPGEWTIDGNTASSKTLSIRVECSDSYAAPKLARSQSSLYYLQKATSSSLEITVGVPSTISTKVSF